MAVSATKIPSPIHPGTYLSIQFIIKYLFFSTGLVVQERILLSLSISYRWASIIYHNWENITILTFIIIITNHYYSNNTSIFFKKVFVWLYQVLVVAYGNFGPSCSISRWGVQTLFVEHRLSCSMACGILVCLPGIEPMSPALHGRFLTNGQLGKSLHQSFCHSSPIHFCWKSTFKGTWKLDSQNHCMSENVCQLPLLWTICWLSWRSWDILSSLKT